MKILVITKVLYDSEDEYRTHMQRTLFPEPAVIHPAIVACAPVHDLLARPTASMDPVPSDPPVPPSCDPSDTPPVIRCSNCHKLFHPADPDQKECSDECRKAAAKWAKTREKLDKIRENDPKPKRGRPKMIRNF